ncbi:hypothetical protein VP01_3401g1 [Puccinia sorghi]|uniref:Uncharacterized protein n=1 Tax=Puccinia sorghi TaxID=27349 RepID=A0A0L6UWK6_9BASI|nr:hypothetical protein VP01_3401g1 [Puccinia sorghi]
MHFLLSDTGGSVTPLPGHCSYKNVTLPERRTCNKSVGASYTFFRSSNEEFLLDLEFTVGVACLLCEGIPCLEQYVSKESRMRQLVGLGTGDV